MTDRSGRRDRFRAGGGTAKDTTSRARLRALFNPRALDPVDDAADHEGLLVRVAYVLIAVSPFVVVSGVIGVVIAARRSSRTMDPAFSHYVFMLRTCLLGAGLFGLAVGLVVLLGPDHLWNLLLPPTWGMARCARGYRLAQQGAAIGHVPLLWFPQPTLAEAPGPPPARPHPQPWEDMGYADVD